MKVTESRNLTLRGCCECNAPRALSLAVSVMVAVGRLARVSCQLDAKPLASPRDHACDCPQERPREPPAQRQVAVVHCVELERRNRTPSALQQPNQLNSLDRTAGLIGTAKAGRGRALNCPAPPLAFTRRFHRLPSAIVRVVPAAVKLISSCTGSAQRACACAAACVCSRRGALRARVFMCACAHGCVPVRVHARGGG